MELSELKDAIDGWQTSATATLEQNTKDLKTLRDEVDKIETRLNRPLTGGQGVARAGEAEMKAWVGFLRHGVERMDAYEAKSLLTSPDTSGGYLAPPEFIREVLKGVVEYSPIRQAATVGVTSAGSVLLPRRTATLTAVWCGETEDRSETAPTYGQEEITIHEAAAYVDISLRLLQDSAVDVAAEVAADLAQEFGRLEGEAFVTGNGVKKPEGFLSNSAVGFVANGHATVLQADAFITLIYSLPAYYRNRGAFIMNGGSLASARKLKDGNGLYLWQPSYQLGQPETLCGRPVIEAVDMPDIPSGAYPIAFGDWATAYRVYDRANGFSVLRDPYSVATKGLVRFHARRRVGGQVVLGEALKKLKIST